MNWVVLTGGVGGARLADGMARLLPPSQLRFITNTGDDFWHWRLRICPDLDTMTYTLAGLAPEERGWGRAVETFEALEVVRTLGGPDWFLLGDRDLGLHITRTAWLEAGIPLTEVTARIAASLGVRHAIIPMADQPFETRIFSAEHGRQRFQDWLVLHRAGPPVESIAFDGEPVASPACLDALAWADIVVIAPSNPYVSVDPILALPGVRERLAAKPVVAVSPIVGGRAIKGPLAAMLVSIGGRAPSSGAVAAHYGDLVSAWVVEHGDADPVTEAGFAGVVVEAATVMRDASDRDQLAARVIELGRRL
jgi:LPPG:FO 2-phospho-L-lactate transferase